MILSIFSIPLLADNLILPISILLVIAILFTKVGTRFGVPVMLIFLLLGMLAGPDGIGLSVKNLHLAEFLGHLAMTVILLTSGLETSIEETRPVQKPAFFLSTLGVFITIVATGFFSYFVLGPKIGGIGATLIGCILLGAVLCSTDSASIFSILRGKRLILRENLGPVLEFESGNNDPMAFVVTLMLVRTIVDSASIGAGLLFLLLQVILALVIGYGVGKFSVKLLERVKLTNSSLYAILILSLAFLSDGLASAFNGNGLLALYVTAIIIGNSPTMPAKRDVLKFFDSITWLCQLLMFLMLGLLARPSEMGDVFLPALMVGLFLIFVARPLGVFLSLLPFKGFLIFVARPLGVFLSLLPFKGFSTRAKLFTSWVGLKGAGPILFALAPVLAGLEGSNTIFNIVFLVTILSLVIQGSSLSWVARKLDLCIDEDPVVETFGMEVPEEMGMLRDHIVSDDDLVMGRTLRDLRLPHGIRVIMVRRAEKYIVPHGSLELKSGDRLVIIMGDTEED